MARNPPTLTLDCPAKVNLALSVGAPRPDGFHPIASWMVAVTFGDTLRLRRAGGETSTLDIRFADDAPVKQPIDWPLAKDLAWRAHALLEAHVGRPLPVAAQLEKRVPAGAGLGGGSSDAAAMLKGLNTLFELEVDEAALRELARALGSDVVFLVAALQGEPSAIVTGLGEVIEPAPLRRAVDLVLVLPPFGCPTGPVYRAFDEMAAGAAVDAARVRALAAGAGLAGDGPFNDLAAAACRVQPRLGEAIERARAAAGRPVHVTGSGAAMFVVAESSAGAATVAQRVTAQTGLAAVATRTRGNGE